MTDTTQTDINAFPEVTSAEIVTATDEIIKLYNSFYDALRVLKTAEVFKIRASTHLDDGWLWIEKGLQQAQVNASKAKDTTSGTDKDPATTSSNTDETKPADDNAAA